MRCLNQVTVIGYVGAAPELRFTSTGQAVANFRVASNRSWRAADGSEKSETEWFRVVVWGKLAEIVNQYVRKGGRVYLQGRQQTRQYDKDGETRYVVELVAEEVILLDGAQGGQNGSRGAVPTTADGGVPF